MCVIKQDQISSKIFFLNKKPIKYEWFLIQMKMPPSLTSHTTPASSQKGSSWTTYPRSLLLSEIGARKYPAGEGDKLRRIPLIIYMCVEHVRQDVGWDAHMLRPENHIKGTIYHPLVFNGYAKRRDLLHMFGLTEGSGGGKDG